MISHLLAAVAGAILFGLVIKNNPKIATKLGLIVDKLKEEIDQVKDKK